MKVNLRYHKQRRNNLKTKWEAIAKEYEGGASVIELSKKYGYTRARIYQIFSSLNEEDKTSA